MKRYGEYKDSGVEWIGEIPARWEVKPLKYFATANDDVLTEKTSPDYIFRYVDIGSVSLETGIQSYQEMQFINAPSRARRKVKKGDVIVSTVRTYLKAIAKIEDDENVIVSTGFAVVRSQAMDHRYLSYSLINNYFVETVAAYSVGVSYPAINTSVMLNIKNIIPSMSIQQSIVAYLDRKAAAIDELIADKQKLVNLLKEKRNAIISEAVTKGLDKTAKMKNSGVEWIGEIPAKWSVEKLKFVGKAIIGLTYSPEDVVDTEDSGTLVFRSSNIQNGVATYDDNVYVNKRIPSNLVTQENDLLICSRNGSKALIGKNILLGKLDANKTFGAFMTVFRSPINKFVYYVFNSSMFEYLAGTFGTSTVNQLTTGNLNNMTAPIPPVSEQKIIVDYLDHKTAQIDILISDINEQIEKLKEYRQAVISEVVTGKAAV